MREYWYVPCNINFCDVITILDTKEYIIWRRGASVRTGDIAYIYIGAPISEILYKCEVVRDDISQDSLGNDSYAIRNDDKKNQKYMKLKKKHKYEMGTLPLKLLKENGLSQVQRQARNGRRLQAFLNDIDEALNI